MQPSRPDLSHASESTPMQSTYDELWHDDRKVVNAEHGTARGRFIILLQSACVVLVKRTATADKRGALALVLPAVSPRSRGREGAAVRRTAEPLTRSRLAFGCGLVFLLFQELSHTRTSESCPTRQERSMETHLHDDRKRRPARDRPADTDQANENDRLPDLRDEGGHESEEREE